MVIFHSYVSLPEGKEAKDALKGGYSKKKHGIQMVFEES